MARARVERCIELSPEIVWDALVDPELVSGWLHPTATLLDGRVLRRDAPLALDAETREFGLVDVRLTSVTGLLRETATVLVISGGPEVDPPFLPPLSAIWKRRVDALEELLRGHPVDWNA